MSGVMANSATAIPPSSRVRFVAGQERLPASLAKNSSLHRGGQALFVTQFLFVGLSFVNRHLVE